MCGYRVTLTRPKPFRQKVKAHDFDSCSVGSIPARAVLRKEDNKVYEGVIRLISGGIASQLDNEVYKAIERVGVAVDKEELIRALSYDRQQYEKGYADGKADSQRRTGRWISADAIFGGEPFYCSECGENTRDTVMGKPRWNFCPNCGADMRGERVKE